MLFLISSEKSYAVSLLGVLRKQQARWARPTLGVFAAVLLAMALQPCAMALGSTMNDCPHCPTQAQDPLPCDPAGAQDCLYFDRLNYDGRTETLKLEDAPGDVSVVVAPGAASLPSVQVSTLLSQSVVSPRYPAGPSLNISFCVFLN